MAQGAAVALLFYMHHTRPKFFRQFHRTVRAAVVRDQDFAFNARALDAGARLVDARREGFGLIQARHQDR